jgi:hypothetical protein
MTITRSILLGAALTLLIPSLAWAAEAETATIEPGGTQLEFKYSDVRNSRDAAVTTRVAATPFLARIGLTGNAELRIETEGHARESSRQRAGSPKTTFAGVTDTSIGVRWRIVDADEKANLPTIASLLILGLPTGDTPFRGDGVSTNIKVAAEWSFNKDASIGVMPGLLRERNGAGSWYVAPTFAVTVGKNWTNTWRTVIEWVSPRLTSKKNGGSIATLNLGSTYSLTDSVELEAVYLRGITKETADRAFLVGVNIKF